MPTVAVASAIEDGFANLKENFWPFMLLIVILGILDSLGQGFTMRESIMEGQWWWMAMPVGGGFLSLFIGVLIKPVFEYGAKLVFVRGHRREFVDVKEVIRGFDSRDLYIDIILANILVTIAIIGGMILLILPGIYVACRTILVPYLVIDKGLAPMEAFKASWELMRDFWFQVVVMAIIAAVMCMGGLILLIVGIFPALAWISGMFASFYQQVIDVHDEEFLRTLGIEP